MVGVISECAQIVVWNQAFEETCLKELAALSPEYRQKIKSMLDSIVDLMDLSEEGCILLGFPRILFQQEDLPVLVPELSYVGWKSAIAS